MQSTFPRSYCVFPRMFFNLAIEKAGESIGHLSRGLFAGISSSCRLGPGNDLTRVPMMEARQAAMKMMRNSRRKLNWYWLISGSLENQASAVPSPFLFAYHASTYGNRRTVPKGIQAAGAGRIAVPCPDCTQRRRTLTLAVSPACLARLSGGSGLPH